MPVGTSGLGFPSPSLSPDPLRNNAVNEDIHLVLLHRGRAKTARIWLLTSM